MAYFWPSFAKFVWSLSSTEALDKESFDLLLGPLEDILARNESKSGGKAPVAPPAGAMHGGRDPNKPKLLGKESMESGKAMQWWCMMMCTESPRKESLMSFIFWYLLVT